MSAEIELESRLINDLVTEKEWSSLVEYLNDKCKIQRNDSGDPLRTVVSENSLDCLCRLFDKLVTRSSDFEDPSVIVLIEVLRSLRNCVTYPGTREYLLKKEGFVENLHTLFKNYVEYSDSNKTVLKLLLQFLINFVISSKEAASLIFNLFHDSLVECLKHSKCLYESSALMYNIYLNLETLKITPEICTTVLSLYEDNQPNEYLLFLTEMFISLPDFWQFYDSFIIRHRLIVLEVIRDIQIKKKEHKPLPKNAIGMLSVKFIKSADVIFQTVSNSPGDMQPYEVSLMLEVLASFAGNEQYLPYFHNSKSCRDLLVNSSMLLLNVHKIGKESENNFSAVQKLNEIKEPNSALKQHPAFGFKVSLIRLIGNLCWKNKEMQDLARTADVIPVILDCCNIDARNPFIIQWAIFAIRNLCEKNTENQKIIASLHQQGTVSSAVLEEIGFTLHSDGDNQIKVVSLDLLKANNK